MYENIFEHENQYKKVSAYWNLNKSDITLNITIAKMIYYKPQMILPVYLK